MAKIEDAQLKAMIKFLEEATPLIEEERVKNAYAGVINSMHNGYENMADNEEKKAWLNYVLANHCYSLGFYLVRHSLISVDSKLWQTVFGFMLPEEAIEIAREFGEGDRQADIKLSKKHIEIENRRKGIEIFQCILSGDTLETAKQKMEEYEKRQAQVLENLEKQQQAPAMQ